MKNMSYGELKGSKTVSFDDFNSFTANCNNFRDAIRAYKLSQNRCPVPHYGLLQLACALAVTEKEILQVYSLSIESPDIDDMKDIIDDSKVRYSEIVGKVTEGSGNWRGVECSDMHIRKALRYYMQSPDGTAIKSICKDYIIQTMEDFFMNGFYKKTPFRLKLISELPDLPFIVEYKKMARTQIIQGLRK